MIDLEKRRENMLRRLKALDSKLHEIEEELESHHTPDWEDLGAGTRGRRGAGRRRRGRAEGNPHDQGGARPDGCRRIRDLRQVRQPDLRGPAGRSALHALLSQLRDVIAFDKGPGWGPMTVPADAGPGPGSPTPHTALQPEEDPDDDNRQDTRHRARKRPRRPNRPLSATTQRDRISTGTIPPGWSESEDEEDLFNDIPV